MAKINKTPDEINQSINFANDLRKLKTPAQISEFIDSGGNVPANISQRLEVLEDFMYGSALQDINGEYLFDINGIQLREIPKWVAG